MILVHIAQDESETEIVVMIDAAVLIDEEKRRILDHVGGGEIVSHYGIYPYPKQRDTLPRMQGFYLGPGA